MTLPRIPEDDDPARKRAKSMRELLQPSSAMREIAKMNVLPSQSQAADEIRKHLQSAFQISTPSVPDLQAQVMSQAKKAMQDHLNLTTLVSKDIATEAAKLSILPVPHDTEKLLAKYHNEAFERQQQAYAEQMAREEEKLELQRRSVAASETALEEERERTREAKAEAEIQTIARRTAERNTRIALVIAFAGLLIAAWPFIRDQL